MSVVAMALALRNLERRLSRGQDVGQYSRDLLTNAAKELERLDDALLSAMTSREQTAADLGAERARLKVTVEEHLERTTALVKAVADMESRYRTTLGYYNDLVVRYDELQQAGEKLAEDRQVQVDALLARVADLEARYADLVLAHGRLLVAFHDATRRPLGVTPESGEEFFDCVLADEAEARYTRHGRGRR